MNSYNRIKKIGAGAMGSAHLVSRKADGQMLVVKEINVASLGEKERHEAMLEVEVHRQLRHPNIVLLHEAFIEQGNLYIVMEFADAGDLSQLIRNAKGRRFKEEKILDLFGQICLGMHHIHSMNILHRDLKTANILLTRSGHIKLADFGIARVMSSDTQMATTMIGTPYYLSPEICEDKPYNHKSDIWSLGCVLYEMVTLKHAFEGSSLPALVMNIIKGIHPEIPDGYSPALRDTINSMLQKDMAKRPDIIDILKQPFLKKRLSPTNLPPELQSPTPPGPSPKNATAPNPTQPAAYAYSNKPKAIARQSAPAPGGQWAGEWKKTMMEAGSGGKGGKELAMEPSRPGTGDSADWMSEMQQRIGAVKSNLVTQRKGDDDVGPGRRRPPGQYDPVTHRGQGRDDGTWGEQPPPNPYGDDEVGGGRKGGRNAAPGQQLSPRPGDRGGSNQSPGGRGDRERAPPPSKGRGAEMGSRAGGRAGVNPGDVQLEHYPNPKVAEGIAEKKAKLAAQRGEKASRPRESAQGSKPSNLQEAKEKSKELKGKVKAAKPKIDKTEAPFVTPSTAVPGQAHSAVNKGVGSHNGPQSGGLAFTAEETEAKKKQEARQLAKNTPPKGEAFVKGDGKVADQHPNKALVSGIGFVTGGQKERLGTAMGEGGSGKKGKKELRDSKSLKDIMKEGRQKKRESGDFDDIVIAPPKEMVSRKGSKNLLVGGKGFGTSPPEGLAQVEEENFVVMKPERKKALIPEDEDEDEDEERGRVVPFQVEFHADTGPATPPLDREARGALRDRCESLRLKAEEVLGMDLFVEVYKSMKESGDPSGALPGRLLEAVGEQRLPIVREINELIGCEEQVYAQ